MKFSQFTQLMRSNSRPDKEQIRKDVLAGCKPKWIKPTAIISSVVLAVGIIGGCGTYIFANAPRGKDNHLPDGLKGISTICAVTAEGDTESLPTDSVLKITTQKTTDTDTVKSHLKVSPEADYTIKKTSGNTFDLVFDGGMKQDTLYKVASTLKGKEVFSWAFQTESEFEITGHSNSTAENTSLLWVEFSHSDVPNLQQYFSITPAISGVFEKYGKRWVFIPSSDFADGTVYTVSISGDIMTESGKVLGDNYSFNFVSRNEKWCDFYYSDDTLKCDTFTLSQSPAGKISYNGMTVSKAAVDVYSIATAEEFINIHNTYVKNSTISDAVIHALTQPVLSFETETLSVENDSFAYFGYPQRFAAGRYISVITINGLRTYHFFQINDTSVYSVSAGGDTSIWVTDCASNRVLTGIPVTSAEGTSVNTDSSGIANFKNQNAVGTAYFTVGTSTPYVCMTRLFDTSYISKQSESYIITDSTHYSSKDTVKIKGFTAPESEVKLYCSWNGAEISVKTDAEGQISEKISLNGTAKDNGYIDLIIDGTCVDTAFLSFDGNKRDVYNVKITTDKPSYIAGETVEYTFYAELTDGTPAENVVITSGDTVLTTNSRGHATFSEQVTVTGDIHREFSVNQPDVQTQIYADYTVYQSGYFIKEVKDTNTALTLIAGFADGFDDETDTSVTLELHRINYQSQQNDTYFNPVTMQKEYTLRSYAVDEVVSTREADYDMKTPIPYTIPADSNTYYMRITWGQSVYYHLISNKEDTVIDSDRGYLFTSRNQLTKGDNLRVSVLPYNNEEILSGKVMVCAISDGIVHAHCYDTNNISFEFTGDTVIAGAYFDKKGIHPIESKKVTERKDALDIKIETEKESYLPGDTVNGSITVTKGGVPQEVNIIINAVKKLVKTKDITSAVHSTAIYETVSTYSQTTLNTVEDSGINQFIADYSDSIHFENITTDIAGKASFSFTLPNKIEDYSIVASCVKGTDVGQTTEKISVTKDFYITPFVEENITAGDDATFSFRVSAIPMAENYNYSVSLFKNGIQFKTLEGSADYHQVKNESFGKLDVGHYTMTISANDGVQNDSVTSEFEISEHTVTDASRTGISNVSGIVGGKKVHLYDQEAELYFSITDKMAALCGADIGSIFARQSALNKMGIEKHFDLSDIFTIEGILGKEPLDAALISALMSEEYDISDILPYFNDLEISYPDTKTLIAVYLTNASQSEPVLDELNILYKQAETMSDDELLCLALAYSYAGDSKKAWDIMDSISPKLRLANGTATYSADTPAQSDYLSCLASIVASKISHSLSKELVKGLLNGVDCDLLGFAYYSFAEYYIPHIEGNNTVIYKTTDGNEEIISYPRATGYTLTLSDEEYDKVSFEAKDGDTLVTISGVAGISQQFDNADTMSVEVSNAEVTDGDSFVITLDINTADTEVKSPYATLTLPHGIKLTDCNVLSGDGRIFTDGNNAEVYFSGETLTAQLTCYAAVEGSYTIQAPVLIDRQGDKYMSGTDTVITVK